MSVIEIATFRLGVQSTEAAFLDADRRVQTEFLYQQPGLVRRTTARDGDGNWIVIAHWRSAAEADAAATRAERDDVASTFAALVDVTTLTTRRYETLD
jgi:hypothetical protein